MGLLMLFFGIGLVIAVAVVVLAKTEGYTDRPHKKDCPKKCCKEKMKKY